MLPKHSRYSEELFGKLNGAVSNEMERQQKLGSLRGFATSTNPVPLVAHVTPTKETPTGGHNYYCFSFY